jgi:hypothetical protein
MKRVGDTRRCENAETERMKTFFSGVYGAGKWRVIPYCTRANAADERFTRFGVRYDVIHIVRNNNDGANPAVPKPSAITRQRVK